MIILFHCLCNLILRILENKRYIRFSQRVVIPLQNEIKLECSVEAEDLESIRSPMYCQRYRAVFQNLLDERWRKQIKTLVDFGSSEVDLIRFLECLSSLNQIVFVDTDDHIIGTTWYECPPTTTRSKREQTLKVTVLAGNAADLDCRLFNVDAITAIELIQRLYPDVLETFLHNVFNYIQPKIIIVTTATPDLDVMFYDDRYKIDHKFDWTREQFEDWAVNITTRFPDYSASYSSLSEGQSAQMAVFVRKDLIDDTYKLTMDFPHCVCGGHSQYKGLTTESKLCKCVCALCYPNASYGICTYYSYSKKIIPKECENQKGSWSCGNSYKLIKNLKYPLCEDNCIEEQKILDKFSCKINFLGQQWGMFYVKEKTRSEIPLVELLNGEVAIFTVPELHKLLTRHGFQIEECLTEGRDLPEPCVIHHPVVEEDRVGMSSPSAPSGVSSPSEPSGYSSDLSIRQLNGESLSDWDERCDKGESGETGEAHQSTKAIFKCTDTATRDSHLDPSTDIEEEKKQHDALFDSGYQKSLSLLDDSPQTPFEDLEETDLFEENISTPSSSSDDNKVHIRRATAPEKSVLPPTTSDINKVKLDSNCINELDRYRNVPTGRPFLTHPVPAPPPEVYRKGFLKDIEPLPGPSSSSRKRKKFKKGLQSDSENDSPLSDIKSIAISILEDTMDRIEIKENDDGVEAAPEVDVVVDVEEALVPQPVEDAQEHVVENGDLANNNRDIEEDMEEADQFEETTSTPSLASQDNRVHLKRGSMLDKASSLSSTPKLKTVDSNRINELDRFSNMAPVRMYPPNHPVPPPPPLVPWKKFAKDPVAGPSKKRRRTKKELPFDDEDTALDDVKAVATCILKNTLNMIDVHDEPELIEYVEVRAESVRQFEVDDEENWDDEGNNYIAQDEADDNVGNDIANDNLEVVGEQLPLVVVVAEENANVDNNNDALDAAPGVVEDPPVVVREPVDVENAGNELQPESAVAQASREVLFDENSEQDLLEDFEIPVPLHEADPDDIASIQLVGIRLASTPEDFDPDQINDGFPNWLLQILGAQAILEEVTPTGSQEGSHFYCQGDGLGVHPSVIAVDVDEEDETTESSNNTADYGETEQGSSQDMASLPEDPQILMQGTENAIEVDNESRLTVSERNLAESHDPGSDLGADQSN